MTADGHARTLALLRRPELAPLFAALRARYENTDTVRRVTLPDPSDAERDAIVGLLGWTVRPEGSVKVKVVELDQVLASSPLACDTRTAVELVGGPIVDRAGARTADRNARADLWRWLTTHPQMQAEPALAVWADHVRRRGPVGTVAETRQLLEQALLVLDHLPSDGRSLPQFAVDALGDAHALDSGPLPNLVLRAVAELTGTTAPTSATQRRELWAAAGVACDALSSTVIIAGFRPPGGGPTATTLDAWAAVGHAAQLTLAQLLADPLAAAGEVWAVENPSVVHAALAQFGPRCPPLMCTSGWPSVAAVTAVRQLTTAGTTVHYHGDIDPQGLRIAAWLVDKAGADPWRLTAEDYLRSVRDDAPAVTSVPDVPWDLELSAAVRDCKRALLEETAIPTLLSDLDDCRARR